MRVTAQTSEDFFTGTGDATQSFEDVGHSSTAQSMMTSYFIGVVEGYDQSLGELKTSKASEGRRSVKVKSAHETSSFTLIDFLLPLFILGVAVVSWYMLTYKNSS